MYLVFVSGLVVLLLLIIQILSGKGIIRLPITCHTKTLAIIIMVAVAAHMTVGFLYFFGG